MGHYFTNDENLKSNTSEIKVNIRNESFTFYTDNGVFSKKGLDFGTRTLIEALELENIKGKILDFGCGYGPIGIIIKKLLPDCQIDMIDINRRSIELAKKNAIKNKVNVNIYESDIYTNVKDKYDFIITNPPIRVGKDILYKILFEAQTHLLDKGELWIVINKDQGAKTVLRDLVKAYNVKLVTKSKGFYIIRAINH